MLAQQLLGIVASAAVLGRVLENQNLLQCPCGVLVQKAAQQPLGMAFPARHNS